MVNLTINNQAIQAEEGQTILDAARSAGIDIPTLCHYRALSPYGACRVCVVQIVDGDNSRLEASCNYPVEEGLKVITDSERVHETRKVILSLLYARCPEAELVKELAREYSADQVDPEFIEDEDCILCGLCARVCSELMGVGAINFVGRGTRRKVSTPFGEHSDVCISCGACAFVCPTGSRITQLENINGRTPLPILSEFDQNMTGRSSIYVPFPQAVPNKPVIDEASCVNMQTGKCGACEAFCEPDAIIYDQEDVTKEIEVGTIILSTGFKTFDPAQVARYNYGRFPDIYTSLEVERMVNATGPTGGEVQLANGGKPNAVGIVHCVGSRDVNTNKYCSAVCCMYSLKLAHLIKERTGAEIYNFYIDMRTPGKDYDEFYDRLLEEGVHFIRGRVAEISDWAMDDREEGKLIIRAEDTLVGVVRRIPVDMVVLSVGMEPQADTQDVRKKFNVSCTKEGWFMERHPKLAPVSTFTDGVFLAGACQGPKDIPASVAQAGAAASEALALIDKGFVELEPNTAYIEAELCSGCKTCIGLCPFTAISYKVIEEDERGVAEVNEALCKGCGTCVAACPSGTADQYLFTDDQIFEEIIGVVGYV